MIKGVPGHGETKTKERKGSKIIVKNTDISIIRLVSVWYLYHYCDLFQILSGLSGLCSTHSNFVTFSHNLLAWHLLYLGHTESIHHVQNLVLILLLSLHVCWEMGQSWDILDKLFTSPAFKPCESLNCYEHVTTHGSAVSNVQASILTHYNVNLNEDFNF